MALESVYLNGGFIGVTKTYIQESLPVDVSFVVGNNYNLSLGASFAYPSGIQSGDFIIIAQSNDSGDVSVVPSDSSSTSYTSLTQFTGSTPDYLISYKFADGTESGSNVTIQNANSRGAAVIQVFRGVDSANPFDVPFTSSSNTVGDPDPQAITTATDKCMIVAIGFLDDDDNVTVTAPSGYTNLNYGESDALAGADSTTMMASKFLETAGTENPPAFTTSGDDSWQSVTLALRSTAGTGLQYQSGIWNLQAVLNSLSVTDLERTLSDLNKFNLVGDPLDIHSWTSLTGMNAATQTRDTSVTDSPFGGVPVRMDVTGSDPYFQTYGNSSWNIDSATSGETWEVRVLAKASVATTGEIFLFGVNSSGGFIGNFGTAFTNVGFSIGTDWQEYTCRFTFSDPNVAFIQTRLDGPQSGGSGVSIWWDGLQVYKVS
jgi:hypothetical protein